MNCPLINPVVNTFKFTFEGFTSLYMSKKLFFNYYYAEVMAIISVNGSDSSAAVHLKS